LTWQHLLRTLAVAFLGAAALTLAAEARAEGGSADSVISPDKAEEFLRAAAAEAAAMAEEDAAEAADAQKAARAALSITHKPHAEGGAQSDIGEAREAAPHDHVAGRRILGAGEITAEPGDLGQIVCQR
jgi:hypothetical protein